MSDHPMLIENARLHQRVMNQRRELRQLNRAIRLLRFEFNNLYQFHRAQVKSGAIAKAWTSPPVDDTASRASASPPVVPDPQIGHTSGDGPSDDGFFEGIVRRAAHERAGRPVWLSIPANGETPGTSAADAPAVPGSRG